MSLRERLLNLSPLQREMDKMVPTGEPFPGKPYMAEGWIYKDLPKMELTFIRQLKELVGDENIVWLTYSSNSQFARGQLLLSPEGQRLLKEYLEARNH